MDPRYTAASAGRDPRATHRPHHFSLPKQHRSHGRASCHSHANQRVSVRSRRTDRRTRCGRQVHVHRDSSQISIQNPEPRTLDPAWYLDEQTVRPPFPLDPALGASLPARTSGCPSPSATSRRVQRRAWRRTRTSMRPFSGRPVPPGRVPRRSDRLQTHSGWLSRMMLVSYINQSQQDRRKFQRR